MEERIIMSNKTAIKLSYNTNKFNFSNDTFVEYKLKFKPKSYTIDIEIKNQKFEIIDVKTLKTSLLLVSLIKPLAKIKFNVDCIINCSHINTFLYSFNNIQGITKHVHDLILYNSLDFLIKIANKNNLALPPKEIIFTQLKTGRYIINRKVK